MTVWYELKTLDGRTLSATFGDHNRWQWVLDNVTADAECREQDVNVEETEEGEYITVCGKPYAQVLREVAY